MKELLVSKLKKTLIRMTICEQKLANYGHLQCQLFSVLVGSNGLPVIKIIKP
jgi:hypothetical protein